jgi:hypothetical protein
MNNIIIIIIIMSILETVLENSSALSLEIRETSWRGNTFLSTVPVKHGTQISIKSLSMCQHSLVPHSFSKRFI